MAADLPSLCTRSCPLAPLIASNHGRAARCTAGGTVAPPSLAPTTTKVSIPVDCKSPLSSILFACIERLGQSFVDEAFLEHDWWQKLEIRNWKSTLMSVCALTQNDELLLAMEESELEDKVLDDAYEVLSDLVKLGTYHKNGKAGLRWDAMVNPTAIFGVIPGNEEESEVREL